MEKLHVLFYQKFYDLYFIVFDRRIPKIFLYRIKLFFSIANAAINPINPVGIERVTIAEEE